MFGDTALAQEHFNRAEQLFVDRRFQEALEEYRAAYDAEPLPEFLYNIGQCYRSLGDYDQAIWYFGMYLAKSPTAGNRASVENLIVELRDAKAERASARRWRFVGWSLSVAIFGAALGGLAWASHRPRRST